MVQKKEWKKKEKKKKGKEEKKKRDIMISEWRWKCACMKQ